MNQANDGALPPIDDIPEARRDSQASTGEAKSSLPWILTGVGAIAVLSGGWAISQVSLGPIGTAQPMVGIVNTLSLSQTTNDSSDVITATVSDQLVPAQRTLLGHKAYDEAPVSELTALTADGSIRLRTPAAEKFQAMVDAARRQRITLVPLSGFRTQEDQAHLFFDIKAERSQLAVQRAEVSAPPGYSEHHSGYAIDIGDADEPETHLTAEFAETAAFEWLQENANRYGFEMTFEADNDQGVAYEPWHWRFVGDRHSLETFYQE
ncbi:D-alanyl-D-alanine carboxypeptidase [filamentous cyanobacterium CCP5]|nr:D-alanyl-D-alanine carboxypeptidase [filamentous cyanobacterium CCP5]